MISNKPLTIELSVIIPTYNEHKNILILLEKLNIVLSSINWQAIIVDDNSPDRTWEAVLQMAVKDRRIQCIRRVGRKGLSSACIEGMLSSPAPFMAVMDADLQHDESLLPLMLKELKEGSLDIVIGSRYINGGGMEGWAESRKHASRLATNFTKMITGVSVQDPMSGFFMLNREFFESSMTRLNGRGFKILLDLLMSSCRIPRYKEIPFHFRTRQFGESKLSFFVIFNFFVLVAQKGLRRIFYFPKKIL